MKKILGIVAGIVGIISVIVGVALKTARRILVTSVMS